MIDYENFEIDGGTFETAYRGTCALDREHVIKRGERVARVIRKDNPTLTVAGVACKKCISEIKAYGG